MDASFCTVPARQDADALGDDDRLLIVSMCRTP